MNKILIMYINGYPYFYLWDFKDPSIEISVDKILDSYPAIKDFDIIETIFDLDTYKNLYHENLYNIR